MRKVAIVVMLLLLSQLLTSGDCHKHHYTQTPCVPLDAYFPNQTQIYDIRWTSVPNVDDLGPHIDAEFEDFLSCIEHNFYVDLLAYPRPYIWIKLDGIGKNNRQWFYCEAALPRSNKCTGTFAVATLKHDCSESELPLITTTPDLAALRFELIRYAQRSIDDYVTDDKEDPYFQTCL